MNWLRHTFTAIASCALLAAGGCVSEEQYTQAIQQRDELDARLTQTDLRLLQKNSTLGIVKIELEQTRSILNQAGINQQVTKFDLADAQRRLKACETDLIATADQLKSADARLDASTQVNTQLTTTLQSTSQDLTAARKEAAAARQELAEARAQAQRQKTESSSALTAAKTAIASIEAERDAARKENKSLSASLATATARVAELDTVKTKLASAERSSLAAKEKVKQFEKELSDLQSQLKTVAQPASGVAPKAPEKEVSTSN